MRSLLVIILLLFMSPSHASNAYDEYINKYAELYAVDKAFVKAVIKQESSFNPSAVSPVGARGLMQLMPATANDLGVTDSFDPEQNIKGGAKYLSWLNGKAWGSPCLILASYNWGIGNVQKLVKSKRTRDCSVLMHFMPAETQNYIKNVINYAQDYGAELSDIDIQISEANDDVANYGGSFFVDMFATYNGYLESNILGRLEKPLAVVSDLFNVLIGIFIILLAFDLLGGIPPQLNQIIKCLVLIKLAISSILFNEYIINGLLNIDDFFIGLFIDDYNPAKGLDSFLASVIEAVTYSHLNGSMIDVLFSWILILDFLGFAGVYTVVLLITDTLIAVCVFLAPIIFIMSIFKTTSSMIKGWLQLILSALIAKILLATVFALTFSVAMDQMLTMSFENILDYMAPEITIAVSLALFFQVPSIAASLTGGLEVSIGNKAFLIGNSSIANGFKRTVKIANKNRQLKKDARRAIRLQKVRSNLR